MSAPRTLARRPAGVAEPRCVKARTSRAFTSLRSRLATPPSLVVAIAQRDAILTQRDREELLKFPDQRLRFAGRGPRFHAGQADSRSPPGGRRVGVALCELGLDPRNHLRQRRPDRRVHEHGWAQQSPGGGAKRLLPWRDQYRNAVRTAGALSSARRPCGSCDGSNS